MNTISVFDMLKIGVGPSSSHTLGPWRAAEKFIQHLKNLDLLIKTSGIRIDLYGSLSLTGKGHATDIALILGLTGKDPEYFPTDRIADLIASVQSNKKLVLDATHVITFDPGVAIVYNKEFLPFHSNALQLTANFKEEGSYSKTYYSIGGGFVVEDGYNSKKDAEHMLQFPFPIDNALTLEKYCKNKELQISDIVLKNELTLRSETEIDTELQRIWNTMLDSMYTGCHTQGILPGGLNVRRRAFDLHNKLKGNLNYNTPHEWFAVIRKTEVKFRQILKWVSCFALSVNEVNASLGRIVTAPTNGSAGVIPAVLMYYLVIENHKADFNQIKQFLLVAGEIGSIFKKGATISAAMGGCQAEIGVSSAMAAGALTELQGGSPAQVLMASEIAMEHHLGLTCDPVGGLVQIPCIERNAMGAIKAINASELALDSDASTAKVPLDKVISSMWETAKDMNSKYKETSEGGLAVSVNMSDC